LRAFGSVDSVSAAELLFVDQEFLELREQSMAWIKTLKLSEADPKLLEAMQKAREPYPVEYATPVFPVEDSASGIVASHALIPDALHHAFSTFGVLMSPELPLKRRQHEMIATMVSVTNRCWY
jgi:hypothetical protein